MLFGIDNGLLYDEILFINRLSPFKNAPQKFVNYGVYSRISNSPIAALRWIS